MVTKKEKQQAADRSGSGARGKTHTDSSGQKGGGKKASSGGTSKGGGQPGGGQSISRILSNSLVLPFSFLITLNVDHLFQRDVYPHQFFDQDQATLTATLLDCETHIFMWKVTNLAPKPGNRPGLRV